MIEYVGRASRVADVGNCFPLFQCFNNSPSLLLRHMPVEIMASRLARPATTLWAVWLKVQVFTSEMDGRSCNGSDCEAGRPCGE